jgi:hypothetical protein
MRDAPVSAGAVMMTVGDASGVPASESIGSIGAFATTTTGG